MEGFSRSKKVIWLSLGGGALLFVFTGVGLFLWMQYLKNTPATDLKTFNHTLSQDELIALTQPAIVRIDQFVQGSATIPAFSFDFRTLDIRLHPGEAPLRLPVKEELLGSGFIINENGYIVTNSHVVSRQTVKQLIVAEIAVAELLRELGQAMRQNTLPPDLQNADEEEMKDRMQKNLLKLVKESQFDLHKEITVLNPNSTQKNLKELTKEGFKAQMISVNDEYIEDEKDMAVLKIDAHDLPTVRLANGGAKIGDRLSIFGFPVTAEINSASFLTPSFTQGVVSAEKFSKDGSFKVFQTDAKVSQGSSGGPMFNNNGEVIGVITFQTNSETQTRGDNFAFALPISLLASIASEHKVVEDSLPKELAMGDYTAHFTKGLAYLDARQGKRALAEFQKVSGYNYEFVPTKVIAPYKEKAEKLISEKRSIDTLWDEKQESWGSISKLMWILGGGAMVLIGLLAGGIVYLFRRMKREETAVSELQSHMDGNAPAENGVRPPLPPAPTVPVAPLSPASVSPVAPSATELIIKDSL